MFLINKQSIFNKLICFTQYENLIHNEYLIKINLISFVSIVIENGKEITHEKEITFIKMNFQSHEYSLSSQ